MLPCFIFMFDELWWYTVSYRSVQVCSINSEENSCEKAQKRIMATFIRCNDLGKYHMRMKDMQSVKSYHLLFARATFQLYIIQIDKIGNIFSFIWICTLLWQRDASFPNHSVVLFQYCTPLPLRNHQWDCESTKLKSHLSISMYHNKSLRWKAK